MADQPSPYSADRAAEWCDIAREAQRQSTEATAQALDSAQRLGQMADAVRALLADLESSDGDRIAICDNTHCWRLATLDDGDQFTCDEHQKTLVDGDTEERSYAPALRRLRALLPEPR